MRFRIYLSFFFIGLLATKSVWAQNNGKPRIIVSTDIGGSDPDDNQSMIHLLMYSDRFEIEGLISSPFGKGRKKDIPEMIDLYEECYQILSEANPALLSAEELRSISRQGVFAEAHCLGYSESTVGSYWIVSCGLIKSQRPLWLLVWRGLEDLVQALYDAP